MLPFGIRPFIRPLRRSDLAQKLPQFEPGALIRCQKCHTSLLSVIPHKHRHKQRQDEYSTEQIEGQKEDRVELRIKWLRLHSSSDYLLCIEHHACPSLLTYNLKQTEETRPKIIEIK